MDKVTFKVAAVQASPVFLNREATVDKACGLIAEAARAGAKIIVFPETFIPTYPDWIWAIPPGEMGRLGELYSELLEQSVTVPGPTTDALCQAAKAAGAYIVVGINERNVEASQGTIYNTLLYIDDHGNLLGKHRKLVPTGAERLVWAQGDGSTLQVFDTPYGRLGGLICWENYMPLARYAMFAWGTQIYVAPTWDRGDGWLASLRHIALEGRVYVIGCCIALRRSDVPAHIAARVRYAEGSNEWINVGNSAIVAPDGNFVAGPIEMKEEILYADLDPALIRGHKLMLDTAGHYARPDVFQLTVNREPRPMIATHEPPTDADSSPAADGALSSGRTLQTNVMEGD
jgi:nitrilase